MSDRAKTTLFGILALVANFISFMVSFAPGFYKSRSTRTTNYGDYYNSSKGTWGESTLSESSPVLLVFIILMTLAAMILLIVILASTARRRTSGPSKAMFVLIVGQFVVGFSTVLSQCALTNHRTSGTSGMWTSSGTQTELGGAGIAFVVFTIIAQVLGIMCALNGKDMYPASYKGKYSAQANMHLKKDFPVEFYLENQYASALLADELLVNNRDKTNSLTSYRVRYQNITRTEITITKDEIIYHIIAKEATYTFATSSTTNQTNDIFIRIKNFKNALFDAEKYITNLNEDIKVKKKEKNPNSNLETRVTKVDPTAPKSNSNNNSTKYKSGGPRNAYFAEKGDDKPMNNDKKRQQMVVEEDPMDLYSDATNARRDDDDDELDLYSDATNAKHDEDEPLDLYADATNAKREEDPMDLYSDATNANRDDEDPMDLYADATNSNKEEDPMDLYADATNSKRYDDDEPEDLYADATNARRDDDDDDELDLYADATNAHHDEEDDEPLDLYGDATNARRDDDEEDPMDLYSDATNAKSDDEDDPFDFYSDATNSRR